MKLEYTIKNTTYQTVKEVLKSHFHISDRLFLKLKRHNQIFLNGKPTFSHARVSINDTVSTEISFIEKSTNIVPTSMLLDILFEDETMLILNKPAGIPVHPSMNHFTDSLSNGVQNYFDEQNVMTKIRPVNRLDKDTSGIVIFAKNEWIQENLVSQMANHTFEKYYWAILTGNLDNNHDLHTIEANISRKSGSIIEREIHPNGQKAISHYRLLQNTLNFCLVEFQLETGRTHQIRIHSQFIGHPLLGDSLYGTKTPLITRQALHAYKIRFFHPISNQIMVLETKMPIDMEKLWKAIKNRE